jgi:plastocyanin
VASFADLQISKPGTGYTLSATASGLASATSSAFDVVSPGVATRIDLLAGDGQTAMVGQAVAISPAVKATDGFGDPVGGVSVTFQEPGTPIGSGVIQTTDIGGVATLGEWRLGTAAGEQTLFALSGDLQGSPVTFTATAEPGPPVTLVLSSGEDQVASLGGLVVEPPAVLVTDNYGNPVAGVAVTFAVASGGGSISGESQVTGVDGIAAVGGWRVGDAPGANTLTATSAGLSGSPAIFHATARSFPTTISVEVHSDYFQSARNGSGNPPGTPAVDTIAVGGTVTWQWVDSGHNVTTVYGASGTQSVPFTFGPVLAPSPGSIVYRCTIHSRIVDFDIVGMWGVIVVR